MQMFFSILISTKNRKEDLIYSLHSLYYKIESNNFEVVVYDDGSTDGTFEAVKGNFPKVNILRNETSKGYIYCRNKMLNETKADYAISLDDDANFLNINSLIDIENFFNSNPKCGVIGFRIFWGKNTPLDFNSNEIPEQVQGFVGCGHVWKIESWKKIPKYPEWFGFYGEEEFASFHLFKNDIQIWYLPSILVHHRVDSKTRKENKDYNIRLLNSLKAGWFNFFLFLPIHNALNLFFYSIYSQIKLKAIKSRFYIIYIVLIALIKLIIKIPKLIIERNALSRKQYKKYLKLPEAKIYWLPQK